MASVTKNDDGKNAMADEDIAGTGEGADNADLPVKSDATAGKPPRGTVTAVAIPGKSSGGFFTVYKSGQGYWTRMGTVGGAAILAILTSRFLYEQASVWFQDARNQPRHGVALGVVVGFVAVFAFLVYRLINRPRVADFLIATDSEMKKVNWTTRRELIGSTKVVIVFMILIALILFGFDTFFGYFFWLIGVLQVNPFGG